VQMGAYGGVPGSANDGGNDLTNPNNSGGSRHQMGGANGGVMMPPGAGRGNAYRNGGGGNYGNQPMMRVPSSGSLGMMPPGNPQQTYGYGGEQGGPARGGGFEALEAQGKGERKQRAAGGKNARGKNAGAKRGADGGRRDDGRRRRRGGDLELRRPGSSFDAAPHAAGGWHGVPPAQHRGVAPDDAAAAARERRVLGVVVGFDDDERELRRLGERRRERSRARRDDDDAPVLHEPERHRAERRLHSHVRARRQERHVRGGGWAGGARGDHREARQGDVAQHQGEPLPAGALVSGAPGRARRRRGRQPARERAGAAAERQEAEHGGPMRGEPAVPPVPGRARGAAGCVPGGGRAFAADGRRRRRRKRTRRRGRAVGDERHSRQARLGVTFEPCLTRSSNSTHTN